MCPRISGFNFCSSFAIVEEKNMSCNTLTCSGYSSKILGFGTYQGLVADYWLKDTFGIAKVWLPYSEYSVAFGSDVFVGIQLVNPMGVGGANVATIYTFDCTGVRTASRNLFFPAGFTWVKWKFACKFGIGCSTTLTTIATGTGQNMPATPPPG